MKRIRHQDGYRAIRVFANLDYKINDLGIVMKELNSEIIPRVLSQFDGVTRGFGGQGEFVERSMKSMAFSALIAVVIMFTILMFLFKSYAQTL